MRQGWIVIAVLVFGCPLVLANQKLTYDRPHHAGSLLREVVAQVPGCERIGPDAEGFFRAQCNLSHLGDRITIYVPDGVDTADVDAIVAAHDKAAGDAADRQVERVKQDRARRQARIDRQLREDACADLLAASDPDVKDCDNL